MLEKIKTPNDIKTMKYDELEKLSKEMRDEITKVISENGGHLASNLGAVELTIAMHRVFDLPNDKIIFDVGHQCYAHKLLTGRADRFSTIRKKDGLSGFTNRFESEYDTLTAGHSGPSVSAGLGLAKANKLMGKEDYVISVVGDGSFTNGMIYEALNNCCDKDLRFIVILNDNEMSISTNVGNLSKHFSKLRTSKRYFATKRRIKMACLRIPVIGASLVKFFRTIKKMVKRAVYSGDGFFSALDIRHFGPVDGHDIEKLEDVLGEAKKYNETSIILVKTQKGKGYDFAEEHPECYHSVGVFDVSEGVVKCSSSTNFSEQFGNIMVEKAAENDKIIALTAAMCEGTGLLEFSKKYPDRFFDVGIAEEHELGFASGLAVGGMKPVCAVYSTFSQRVYDQVFHDFSVQKLPCVLALDRSGFVPDDGVTHQGLFDVSLFSSVPDTVIYSPETYAELRHSFDVALDEDCVSVVRYPKGSESTYDRSGFVYDCDMNIAVMGDEKADVVILTYGRITKQAYDAARILSEKTTVKIVKLVKIYPLDINAIVKEVYDSKIVYLLEEGIKSGGIAEKISSDLSGSYSGKVIINAVDNECAFHASTEELIEHFGMSAEKIAHDISVCL